MWNHLICRYAAWCAILVWSSVQPVHSQVEFSFSAPDSLGFLISINHDTINRKPVKEITFYSSLSGKQNIRVIFPYSPMLEFQQVIHVKPYTSVKYALNYAKNALKFTSVGETVIDPQRFPKYVNASAPQAVSEVSKGCFPQSDQLLFESLIKALEQNTMESRKLEIMKEYAGSQCITVVQLRQLFGKLMQEDNKLELLSTARSHIYNPENLNEVLEDFFLERSKLKAQQIIR
jgi:hypothetical protein